MLKTWGCTDGAQALPPSLVCIATQTENHSVTSATSKGTRGQLRSMSFQLRLLQCELSHVASVATSEHTEDLNATLRRG